MSLTGENHGSSLASLASVGGASERLDPLEKAAKNPGSRAFAIAAKCYDCMGQDADPGWRTRIGSCGCTSCPLHPFRPYQKGTKDE